jgi:hypothetical protein
VASWLTLYRNGAVGFIDWLDAAVVISGPKTGVTASNPPTIIATRIIRLRRGETEFMSSNDQAQPWSAPKPPVGCSARLGLRS